jgi:hypothetical protein
MGTLEIIESDCPIYNKDGTINKVEKHVFRKLLAPWINWEVESLNCYQKAYIMHPFTCGNGGHSHGELRATINGWVCDKCDYVQDWCHEWMANWEWIFIHATEEDLKNAAIIKRNK